MSARSENKGKFFFFLFSQHTPTFVIITHKRNSEDFQIVIAVRTEFWKVKKGAGCASAIVI